MAKPFSKIFNIDASVFQNFEMVWLQHNFDKEIPKDVTHVFVNSMSDVAFWTPKWLELVVKKMQKYPDVKFLFLTKDVKTSVDLSHSIDVMCKNSFLGVSVTNNAQLEAAQSSDCSACFISLEPIQEKIDVERLRYFDWVIVGAETGNRKGRVVPQKEWIEEIREYCQLKKIPLYEKDSLKSIVNRPLIQERI
jgi:protein gp37